MYSYFFAVKCQNEDSSQEKLRVRDNSSYPRASGHLGGPQTPAISIYLIYFHHNTVKKILPALFFITLFMETSFGSVFVERYIQFGAGPVLNYSYFIPTFHRQIPTFFLNLFLLFFLLFLSKATFKPVNDFLQIKFYV